jgi:cytochrome P450
MNILGVPEQDFGRMLRLTQELFGASDPDTERFKAALSDEQFAALLVGVVQDFTDYFEQITADRRASPRDDLSTLLANAEIDGQPLPPFERTGYYTIIATAGHDTTSSSTAAAMWALATVPGLLDRVRADPSLIPALIEESIRWATPVKTFMRSASADTELRRRQIKQGDWLMLCYASGNRDEGCSKIPTPSTSTASPIANSPSVMARISASANISRAWKCVSSTKSCCRV